MPVSGRGADNVPRTATGATATGSRRSARAGELCGGRGYRSRADARGGPDHGDSGAQTRSPRAAVRRDLCLQSVIIVYERPQVRHTHASDAIMVRERCNFAARLQTDNGFMQWR